MKIGIDIRPLNDRKTGIGRYLDELIDALLAIDTENEYIFFYNALKGAIPNKDFNRGEVVSSRWPNKLLTRLWSSTSFPSIESLVGEIDVFHGPSFQMAPTRRASKVLTIHDLVFLVQPELAAPKAVQEFLPHIKRFARRADIIVADSQATAKDITYHLGVPAEKIAVVYPGTTIISRASNDAIRDVKKRYGIDGDFILFVGTLEPRKNLSRLFKAFNLSGLNREYSLVLAGPKGWRTEEIENTWHSLTLPRQNSLGRLFKRGESGGTIFINDLSGLSVASGGIWITHFRGNVN